MIECGKCNEVWNCIKCKFTDLKITEEPCRDCHEASRFICKACEDEKIKQARFEKYLEDKEEKRK